ncbi:hypothetical protein ACFL3J_00870 [Candidatus Omnitrophota bacterium]
MSCSYEIDPYNRLIIKKTGKKSGLPRFRKVLDGRFNVYENNNLSYRVKAPFEHDLNIPHQLKLKGTWSLTDNHNLRLTLNKEGRKTLGDKLTLEGRILDVSKNSLLFAVTTKTKDGKQSTYILSLKGTWKVDKNNRLSFHLGREKDRRDILIFKGAWKLNKNHQIIYEYEKADLIRKKKRIHTLTFKGYWDIRDKFRISYVLDGSTDSSFNFKTAVGIFKGNYIQYEVGVGLAGRAKPIKRTLRLFGKWKIKKGRGLAFEVEYENRKVRAITFGADIISAGKNTVSFKLKNDIADKDMGASLKLSHKILKGVGTAFLRLSKSRRESAIYAGVARSW